MKKPIAVARLVLLIEGEFWNAYCAQETMSGKFLLGSIRISAVERNEDRKQRFVELMRDYMGEFLADFWGGQVKWDTQPEHNA